MSGASNSKGKDRAVEPRPETNNADREHHEPTTAEETNDEGDDQDTIDQMQELQRVLTAVINKAPQQVGEASGNNTKKRKADQIRLASTSGSLPKIPKKSSGKARAEVDTKTDRQATIQGDSELNNILASLPDDTITHHEKLQLEVGARIRDMIIVCQSLMEGVANNVETLLEAAPDHLPKDGITLIEQLSTITTHLDEANELTKQNFTAISKQILDNLYKNLGLDPEAKRLMNLVTLANTLDPSNKVSVDNLKSVKQLNDTARTLMAASNPTSTTPPNPRPRQQSHNYPNMSPPMIGGYAHPGGMAPMMYGPRGGGSAGAQWYGPGGPAMMMMGNGPTMQGGNPWRGVAPDQCRRCGMRGHYAAQCPTRAQNGQQPPHGNNSPRIQLLPWYELISQTITHTTNVLTCIRTTELVQAHIEAVRATGRDPSDVDVCRFAELFQLRANYDRLRILEETIDTQFHTTPTSAYDESPDPERQQLAKRAENITRRISNTQAAMQALCPHIPFITTAAEGVFLIGRPLPYYNECAVCTMRRPL